MNAASVLPWAALLPGSVALALGMLNIWKDWRTGDDGRRAKAFADRSEGAAKSIEATSLAHQVWMKGSQGTIARLEKDFNLCREREDRLEDSIYGLFDDIDEQIAPMLMLPDTDKQQILDALRAVVRKARNRIRPHPTIPQ